MIARLPVATVGISNKHALKTGLLRQGVARPVISVKSEITKMNDTRAVAIHQIRAGIVGSFHALFPNGFPQIGSSIDQQTKAPTRE